MSRVVLVLACLALGACGAPRVAPLPYVSATPPAQGSGQVAMGAVSDTRGRPDPASYGSLRGTYGNVIQTFSTDGPVADTVARSFSDALAARGMLARGAGGRQVRLTVSQFDANRYFRLEAKVTLRAEVTEGGRTLYETTGQAMRVRGSGGQFDGGLFSDKDELAKVMALALNEAIDKIVDDAGFRRAVAGQVGAGAGGGGPPGGMTAAALARTALRYHGGGRFARHYVASKLRTDPVHRTVLALAAQHPFGAVTDVGCGRGQLGVALLEAKGATSVLGLDWAGASLRDAGRAGAGLAFMARAQDLASDPAVPACDTVLLIDVLYILQQRQALAVLAHAAAAARRLVLVRTLDPGLGLRSRFHLALERLGQPFWPHAGATVDPAPWPPWSRRCKAPGFTTTIAPCWQGTPFANVLLTARRL